MYVRRGAVLSPLVALLKLSKERFVLKPAEVVAMHCGPLPVKKSPDDHFKKSSETGVALQYWTLTRPQRDVDSEMLVGQPDCLILTGTKGRGSRAGIDIKAQFGNEHRQ